MAEIKTCEQYVLSRIQDLEEENHNLLENIDSLTKDYNKLILTIHRLKKNLLQHMEIRTLNDDSNIYKGKTGYITCSDIDEWKEKEVYDFMKEFLEWEKEEYASISD